jgi:hypothetical protein
MIENHLLKGEAIMLKPSPDPDTIFAELLQDLPPELAELARQFKAFARARKIKTPEQLMRVVLLFAGLDFSEREIAANLVLVDPTIKEISDQSVHDRLRACLPWMQALLPRLIQREQLPILPSGLRLLVIDATDITAPGQTKTTWRLHIVMDAVSLQLVSVQLTDRKTGETLLNFRFASGEIALCDRGYSHRRGVAHVLNCGGEVIVRYNPHHIPVEDRAGNGLDLATALVRVEPGERCTLEVRFIAPDGKSYEVWIHAYRLPPAAAAEARRRCRREGQRGGYTPRASTLFFSEFVMVLTSVRPEVLSAETVLELYRCRWQVELLIKKWKSLLDLDQVRARAGSVLGQVWLHGKLLYACLLERRCRRCCGPEWARLDSQRRGTWWRVWKLIKQEIEPLITLQQCWNKAAWPAALDALAERKRKRRLQSLPEAVVIWLQQPAQTTDTTLKMAA